MRAGGAADQIVGVPDVSDPGTDGLVHRIFQRPGARLDNFHTGAQQLHAEDVE